MNSDQTEAMRALATNDGLVRLYSNDTELRAAIIYLMFDGPIEQPSHLSYVDEVVEDIKSKGITTFEDGWINSCAVDLPQAALASQQVPEGYKLVPIEPTKAMKIAGDNAGFWCADKYRAMLAAATAADREGA